MCLCKQTGRMFESLVWKTVLSDCFTQALSAWFSRCFSQLLGPRLLSITQMLPWSLEGTVMSLSDRSSTIGQVQISGSLKQVETTHQALKLRIIWLWSEVAETWLWLNGYSPWESWECRGWGWGDPVLPWDCWISLPQMPEKVFLDPHSFAILMGTFRLNDKEFFFMGKQHSVCELRGNCLLHLLWRWTVHWSFHAHPNSPTWYYTDY